MKLYHVSGTCSLAVMIVLEWSREPYHVSYLSMERLKRPEYLALNPSGTVPMLEDGDFRLTENVAILGYLAERHPELRLLGDGSARGRAEVMSWLGFLNSEVHKAFKPIFTPWRFLPNAELATELGQVARSNLRKYFERLDERLSARDWLTGQRSVADPYLFVLTRWTARTEVPLQGLEHLARFVARMNADPGVHAALAAEQAP